MVEVDEELRMRCERAGATYVRYADDLTIRFKGHDRKKARRLIQGLKAAVRKIGQVVHPTKRKITRIGKDSDSAEVIGILVQPRRIGTSKKVRNRMRGLIRRAIREARREEQSDKTQHLLNRVGGYVCYMRAWAKAMQKAHKERLSKRQYSRP
jgi:ribosomal protein S17E